MDGLNTVFIRIVSVVCTCVALLGLTSGCVSWKEGLKGFLGISTQILEDERGRAVRKQFACDYETTRSRIEEFLKDIKAYPYARDSRKKLIAVYVSESNTTPVGIFFVVDDTTHTTIEVSSPSTDAKERIARRLFRRMDRFLNPELPTEGFDDEIEDGN